MGKIEKLSSSLHGSELDTKQCTVDSLWLTVNEVTDGFDFDLS